VVCLLLFSADPGDCSIILSAGDSYSLEFTSLDYFGPYTGPDYNYAAIGLAPASQVSTQFIFSLYENSINEPYITSWTESVILEFGLHGFYFSNGSMKIPWQDMQGIFYIEMLSGAMALDSLYAAAIIDGDVYHHVFRPVPIPGSLVLLMSGLFPILASRPFKKRSKNRQ
jgi:hypothetical protein